MAEIIGRRERFQNFFHGFLNRRCKFIDCLPNGQSGMAGMPIPAASLPYIGDWWLGMSFAVIRCTLLPFRTMTVPYPETKPHVQGHHS